MTLSIAAQATLLLTSYFSKPAKCAAKPLTPTEWGRFAQWLHETNHTPEDLLSYAAPWVLGKWSDEKIPRDRLEALLQRGSSMALALEKWQRSGLWVITRSDPEYPRRLKKRLKHAAPPVLYGCGNLELLNAGGLAVVGSRKASDIDLAYAHELGTTAARSAIGTVSGGAKGIDDAAMRGGVEHGGPVIGILSEGLLRAATSSQWRQGLMSESLVLISPYYPEASFNTGNAMGRNKYIYCLADAAVVVHSGASGGTKAGAEENLKKGWVPLWVKPTQDSEAGNQALVDAGGAWCEQDIEQLDIGSLFATTGTLPSKQTPYQPEPTLATDSDVDPTESEAGKALEVDDHGEAGDAATGDSPQEPETEEPETAAAPGETDSQCLSESAVGQTQAPQSDLFRGAESSVPPWQPGQIDFYKLFLSELQRLAHNPKTGDEITAETGLHKTQVNAWLKQAIEEGRLKKLTRPVRYCAIQEQADTVDDDVESLVRRLRTPRTFETSS
jgi:predicted Rossmann fold nucleotide-binding protein DprA/Smf involved in DNA uptake